ncbi:hypothetical protein L0Z26_28820 [Burkholderia multivorans]|nr:hypothetical protein [Burkholderia multivorans]
MNTTADSLVKLAARVDAIQPFYVMELMKEAQQLESAGRDVIHMGIGEPDFTAPEPVVERRRPRLRRGVTQYTERARHRAAARGDRRALCTRLRLDDRAGADRP